MIRMVKVNKQSVTFCKYMLAGLLWLAVILQSVIPVYIVLCIMLVSAMTGVHRAPLVLLFDLVFAKHFSLTEIYINMHSMRFAHIFGVIFSVLCLISFYWISPLDALVLTVIFALLQTIASFGYCSAQKLYECVI